MSQKRAGRIRPKKNVPLSNKASIKTQSNDVETSDVVTELEDEVVDVSEEKNDDESIDVSEEQENDEEGDASEDENDDGSSQALKAISLPPLDYAIPPATPKDDWIVPEPATGTLVQGCLAVAKTSTREFASWSRALSRKQLLLLLGVGTGIAFLNEVISGLIILLGLPRNSSTLHTIKTDDANTIQVIKDFKEGLFLSRASEFSTIFTGPIFHLLLIATFTLALTLMMPSYFGTFRARFVRVLKPVVLASIPFAVFMAIQMIAYNVIIVITQPSRYLATSVSAFNAATSAANSWVLAGNILVYGSIAYAMILFMQAGLIGSTLKRYIIIVMFIVAFFISYIIQSMLTSGIMLLVSR